MPSPRPATALTPILLERIRQHGPITFADFMEVCLYHPEHGYYTRNILRAGVGDYYTSPDVHPIFGRLLARQLCEMWEILGCPREFYLVEFGAGQGTLAATVLDWIGGNAPEFARTLRLLLLERSPVLRQRGEQRLAGRWTGQVRWAAELDGTPLVGCFYSNELVDVFPVHRVVQRPAGLREIYVAATADELIEQEGELSSPALADYLAQYGAPLAQGQQAEVGLQALAWLEQVAAGLAQGFVLTIDYGYLASELYSAVRPAGTLLAYHRHRVSDALLAWPGLQDLTAHVNFTALIEHGRKLGLLSCGYTTQTKFLLALGKKTEFADLYAPDTSEAQRYKARLQLKQLIYPEGMGETFKVLVQAKGLPAVSLTGLGDF